MQFSQLLENKSRHITPAQSAHDFQVNDGLLIKSGDSVTRKIVTAVDYDGNTITAADPDGTNQVTVTIDPDNLPKDGGEFKYWIDESQGSLAEMDDELDFELDGVDVDGDLGSLDDVDVVDDIAADDIDDVDIEDVDIDDDEFAEDEDAMDNVDLDDVEDEIFGEAEDDEPDDSDTEDGGEEEDDDTEDDGSFEEDLKNFLGEEEEADDAIIGGGVDDTSHADNDGEDTEETPPPHDTTGLEDVDDLNDLARDRSSNTPGSAPTDEVDTNGSAGLRNEHPDETAPETGEHEPGEPDKAVSEAIREDVDTAVKLVRRGYDPNKLALRLLRGAS